MVGHMIDVTEGYLTRWEKARKNEPIDTVGLLVMAEQLNEHAQAFRSLPREEAISPAQERLPEDDGYLREADRRRVGQFHRHPSLSWARCPPFSTPPSM